jgi:predicted hydrocarbon binding protein
MPPSLAAPRLALGRSALLHFATVLERVAPGESATLLRETGFAAGQAAYEGLVESVALRYGVESPQGLDARYLGDALAGYFREAGWGTVSAEQLAGGVLAVDSPDWAEAEPRGAEFPSCHFSVGLLSDLFTRAGGQPAAVMEVECRSRGDTRCRFLVGSPAMLNWLYDGMTAGSTYPELLARES